MTQRTTGSMAMSEPELGCGREQQPGRANTRHFRASCYSRRVIRMLTLIEALNFRCLRHVRQPLGPFHVLVGPNASGKTTFLDVVAFLGDLVADGLEEAVRRRTQNFEDLLWRRQGDSFQLAIEAKVPEAHAAAGYAIIRYEVEIGIDRDADELGICVRVGPAQAARRAGRAAAARPLPRGSHPTGNHPRAEAAGDTGGGDQGQARERQLLLRGSERCGGKGWIPTFKLGPRRSTLANLARGRVEVPGVNLAQDSCSPRASSRSCSTA